MKDKIIIGVHGIGDQVRYETIQSIAYQFCRHYRCGEAVPVGSFYSSRHNGVFPIEHDGGRFYFTEVYWADVARGPETEGYTLEETKKWAKTIVERVRSTAAAKEKADRMARFDRLFRQDTDHLRLTLDGGRQEGFQLNYRMIKSVLYGMIDTVAVLERLLLVTEKAGIFKFDLNRVLVDYLGDVQVVTEFEKYRDDIVKRFFDAAENAYQCSRDAEIYVISHSEGTVVSLLSLLNAICGKDGKREWIGNVKGFMTIGSPIDKHIILWPGLWDCFSSPAETKTPIRWLNYYDKGDPVGYELDTARVWLKEKGIKAFEFNKTDDYGFSRYFLPGKAHVDYWQDDQLFDHFIETVVDKPPASQGKSRPPATKFLASLTGYTLPYLGWGLLLFLASYFLYKSVHECIFPNDNEGARALMRNAGGIASVLAGMTVMARIPRLSRRLFWYLASGAFFAASLWAYGIMTEAEVRERIGNAIFSCEALQPYAVHAVPLAATAVVLVVSILGYLSASARTIPLIATGGAVVLAIAARIILFSEGHASVWPVFIGSALFLYLWWLAILAFDLIFIWHAYIRSSRAIKNLRKVR